MAYKFKPTYTADPTLDQPTEEELPSGSTGIKAAGGWDYAPPTGQNLWARPSPAPNTIQAQTQQQGAALSARRAMQKKYQDAMAARVAAMR